MTKDMATLLVSVESRRQSKFQFANMNHELEISADARASRSSAARRMYEVSRCDSFPSFNLMRLWIQKRPNGNLPPTILDLNIDLAATKPLTGTL